MCTSVHISIADVMNCIKHLDTAATYSLGACFLAGKPQNRKKKEVEAAEMEAVVEGTDEGATLKVTTKKSRAKAEIKFPQFGRCPQPCSSPGLLFISTCSLIA